MPALSDTDMALPYVAPVPSCDHQETEFKIHLLEYVCRCGARRRDYGPDRTWKRLDNAIDQRQNGHVKHHIAIFIGEEGLETLVGSERPTNAEHVWLLRAPAFGLDIPWPEEMNLQQALAWAKDQLATTGAILLTRTP